MQLRVLGALESTQGPMRLRRHVVGPTLHAVNDTCMSYGSRDILPNPNPPLMFCVDVLPYKWSNRPSCVYGFASRFT